MYRDDLEAAHARTEALQQELANAQAGHASDRQRIAELTAQLQMAQQALQRLGGPPRPGFYLLRPRGTAILVLGVLSIMLCNILGPVAWLMGNEELRRIDSGQVDPMTRSAASAGRICGIVSTVFMMIAVVLGISLVMIFAISHGSHY